MNYEQMTLEELEAENIRLSNEVATIKRQQREINDIYSRKVAQRDMAARFAGLSDDEKAALAQVIGVQTAGVGVQAKGV